MIIFLVSVFSIISNADVRLPCPATSWEDLEWTASRRLVPERHTFAYLPIEESDLEAQNALPINEVCAVPALEKSLEALLQDNPRTPLGTLLKRMEDQGWPRFDPRTLPEAQRRLRQDLLASFDAKLILLPLGTAPSTHWVFRLELPKLRAKAYRISVDRTGQTPARVE